MISLPYLDIIFSAFPNLSEEQKKQIEMLYPLYNEWNSKINVISRKAVDRLYLHHVLHSLAIAKYANENNLFIDGMSIMDVGTGGGFPSIPLAILFPNIKFVLVDSIGKKIKVVNEVSIALGLKNVVTVNGRAEDVKENFDFMVSRAVTDLSNFLPWVKGKYSKGILYLKGGDLNEGGSLYNELKLAKFKYKIKDDNLIIKDIYNYYKDDFFTEKRLIFIKK